jgi:hypothetical protein
MKEVWALGGGRSERRGKLRGQIEQLPQTVVAAPLLALVRLRDFDNERPTEEKPFKRRIVDAS